MELELANYKINEKLREGGMAVILKLPSVTCTPPTKSCFISLALWTI